MSRLRFLSTPSARRATGDFQRLRMFGAISIHALREEGDIFLVHCSRDTAISIHALREEGDAPAAATSSTPDTFLSTPSARRATDNIPVKDGGQLISIHALREEGDGACFASCTCKQLFLSTPSARRAT